MLANNHSEQLFVEPVGLRVRASEELGGVPESGLCENPE